VVLGLILGACLTAEKRKPLSAPVTHYSGRPESFIGAK
jgi:hypothetical protein